MTKTKEAQSEEERARGTTGRPSAKCRLWPTLGREGPAATNQASRSGGSAGLPFHSGRPREPGQPTASCKPPSGPDTSRLFNLAFLRPLEIWTLDCSPVDVGEFGVFRCELASWLCFVFRALIFGRCRRMYLRVK